MYDKIYYKRRNAVPQRTYYIMTREYNCIRKLILCYNDIHGVIITFEGP